MKIKNINIKATLEKARQLIDEDTQISAATRSIVEILILIITLLANRLNLDSSNSSKPPSNDPNRKKRTSRKSGKKPGGQKGHIGTTLQKVDDPDYIEPIEIDRRRLPAGNYRKVGYESRQVFDIEISGVVTEYRAEILQDEFDNRFVAAFPEGVTQAAQYGPGLKAHAVYMSQFQLIPYNRIVDYFADQMQIPVSEGSIYNFNCEAFGLLEPFESRAKDVLAEADLAHADETGINIGGKRHWLHCVSNEHWTLYFPHEKRGTDAFNAMGVLARFTGILCHDHWKPYYTLSCTHALCNAHHLRELAWAAEQDGQMWAEKMSCLLEKINIEVINAGGCLSADKTHQYRLEYRWILEQAQIECPEPVRPTGKRGRMKKTKSRNLLERLRDYESDVLRFMEHQIVPFTNNLGERDIRMTKVQQKISGCFRSMQGAYIFCQIRGFLSTCRKQGVRASQALNDLFNGKTPDFMTTCSSENHICAE